MGTFRLSRLLLVVLALMPSVLSAQVAVKGRPTRLSLSQEASLPSVRTATVDVRALMAEDSLEESKDTPHRFGFPFEVNYSLDNSGSWEMLPDGGRVWRLVIESPGAYSINLVYREFYLPEGGRLFIYNRDQSYALGAFTALNNKEYDKFATAPIPGDACILEYQEPPGAAGEARIRVQRVIHAYRDIFAMAREKASTGFGSSGSCEVNINCPEGASWSDDKRAVAMILTQGGFRICTGTLVNNARQDMTPLFLTANHCLGEEETWVFMFNYESPGCTSIDGPTWMTTSGASLLATNTYSDFALLELAEAPPSSYEVYYAGWSALGDTPVGAVTIHHPMGDIKKISIDEDDLTSAEFLLPTGSGDSHWRVGSWDTGTTEPGSSGCPLFDTAHHIVGQLHGGYASCKNTLSDWFGKFSESWSYGMEPSTQLRPWLDADNTGVDILDGRDRLDLTLYHLPLADTREFVQVNEVRAIVAAGCLSGIDSAVVAYEIQGVWNSAEMVPADEANVYQGYIPYQPAGTTVRYFVTASDNCGQVAVTDTFEFNVLDNGVVISPSSSTKTGRADSTVLYTLKVYNTGIVFKTFSLSSSGNVWPVEFLDQSGNYTITQTENVQPGGSFAFRARVQIGPSLYGDVDLAMIVAASLSDSTVTDDAVLATVSRGRPMTLPLTEAFGDTVFDRSRWIVYANASINDLGMDEPSPPYSVNLDGEPGGIDSLISQIADLSGMSSLVLSYCYERGGGGEFPEPGEDMIVEYRNVNGIWKLLARYYGDGPAMTAFVRESMGLPADAYYDTFQLRFRSFGGSGSGGDWFVDDISVDYAPVISVSPAVFADTLYPDEIVVRRFLVANTGLAPLYYVLDSVPSWLGIDKTLGQVASGGIDTLTLVAQWAELDTGVVADTMFIATNDPSPGHNPLVLPIDLLVYPCRCGDLNCDDKINLSDITCLIAYVYLGGGAPAYEGLANIDGDAGQRVNLSDVTWLIGYTYLGGSEPRCGRD